jgi:hypothetical protein
VKASETLFLVARYELTFAREVSDEGKKLWLELLYDIDPEDAKRALDSLAGTETYPPTPQKIRRVALEESIASPPFGEAWAEMVEAASTCDYFDSRPPPMSHPAIDELARQIGWGDFRVSNPEDTYYQHSARERYSEIVERSTRRMMQGLPAFDPMRFSSFEDVREMQELTQGIDDE